MVQMNLFQQAWRDLKAEADAALKRRMQDVWERANDANARTNVVQDTTKVVSK